MKLDQFVLIIVSTLSLAAVAIAVLVFLAGAVFTPGLALIVAVPAGIVAYVVIRVITDRAGNAEDDYYDRIEK
ncbi:hypothetical protein [Pontivivens ytuae]|uniref:Uncharacterized protein n=1 Tax=Pontivivens ytuae TaxID=2789856 RepID=A0A7S9LQU3_9RHOB|nr:hypothetical protein [Pontivivens ytuae]QPH53597.1 hypothetical protein I0K15_17725 [Pontivivens ytuae]